MKKLNMKTGGIIFGAGVLTYFIVAAIIHLIA